MRVLEIISVSLIGSLNVTAKAILFQIGNPQFEYISESSRPHLPNSSFPSEYVIREVGAANYNVPDEALYF